MRAVYLIGWAVTRPVALFFYYMAEPFLLANIWFKRKWLEA